MSSDPKTPADAVSGGEPRQAPLPRPDVDARLVLSMVSITALIGFNSTTIRLLVQGMSPIMGLTLRGLMGLVPLTLYGRWRGERIHFRGWPAVHLCISSLFFAAEFIFMYVGARYTTAGRIAIFINTAPFFTTLGAHYLLRGDRLHLWKVLGMLLAFCGVVLLFSEDLLVQRAGLWRGDLLVIGGAISWAALTLYIKRFLSTDHSGFQALYPQIVISTGVFYLFSLLLEPDPFFAFGWDSVGLLAFQAIFLVNVTYLVFIGLLRHYPASAVISFTLLSPFWGVASGIVFLGEGLSVLLVLGFAMVTGGLYLVNRPRPVQKRTKK